jgi:hypothetical protein
MATYMQFTQVTTLAKLEQLANSRNGNPRFKVTLANGQSGKTKTDAGFAYAIGDFWQGKTVRAEYHVMQSGNLSFTDLELI